MSNSIKLLMILVINLFLTFVLVQCDKKEEKFKISYSKSNSHYSFIMETPSKVFYSTPSNFELKSNTLQSKENIIFKEELKKFKPYRLSSKKQKFENIYISNVLGETSFTNNHLFEYDVEINKFNHVRTNIYYPYDLIGSYEFNLDNDTSEILARLLYQITNVKSGAFIERAKFQNVIIYRNNNKLNIFGGERYIYEIPEYSLFLSIINGLLLEKINNKSTKIDRVKIYSENFINRQSIPPAPPSE